MRHSIPTRSASEVMVRLPPALALRVRILSGRGNLSQIVTPSELFVWTEVHTTELSLPENGYAPSQPCRCSIDFNTRLDRELVSPREGGPNGRRLHERAEEIR